MNSFRYDYTVIGGDLRQVYLATELARAGCRVCQYALCRPLEQICPTKDTKNISSCSSFEDACQNSACIICPIPLSKDGIFLNQNRTKKTSLCSSLSCTLRRIKFFAPAAYQKNFAPLSARKTFSSSTL